jgi:hypothetical protein
VGVPLVAQRFARDYAEMWDVRYRQLAAPFEARDRDSALDAVISLKISSAMIGGLRLGHLAEDLENHPKRGTRPRARAPVPSWLITAPGRYRSCRRRTSPSTGKHQPPKPRADPVAEQAVVNPNINAHACHPFPTWREDIQAC